MKLENAVQLLWFACIPLLAMGCGQSSTEASTAVELNLNPTTLEQAERSLEQIDALQKHDPVQAQSALATLQPRLDELNHLVARVEPEPGHFVSFYESEPGQIGIAETGPAKSTHLLTSEIVGRHSATEIFEQVAKGAVAPERLVQAQAREISAHLSELPKDNDSPLGQNVACSVSDAPLKDIEGVASKEQALTSGDGPWWAANVCYTSGDFRGCFPNWGGGGYATASAKTSFFQVAPFSGDFVSVRFQYSGSTKFTDPVFPGDWGGWWWHSDSFWDCCGICACGTKDYNRRSHRWDILNASGDGFHWTHAFKWSCGNTLSCDQSP